MVLHVCMCVCVYVYIYIYTWYGSLHRGTLCRCGEWKFPSRSFFPQISLTLWKCTQQSSQSNLHWLGKAEVGILGLIQCALAQLSNTHTCICIHWAVSSYRAHTSSPLMCSSSASLYREAIFLFFYPSHSWWHVSVNENHHHFSDSWGSCLLA
jgi:hypothetical protein